MWLFEQSKPSYGNDDTIGIMRDVQLATWALSLSDKTRSTHNARAIELLSKLPNEWANIRNTLFASKDAVVRDHTPDITKLQGADRSNLEYQRLIAMREMLLANPQVTLKALDTSIEGSLSRLWATSGDIQTIEDTVWATSEENFATQWEKISGRTWHIWKVFFLEWCVHKGKCIDQVIKIASEFKKKFESTNSKSFEYWDFHNVLRLAETKSKLNTLPNNSKAKSFVLSGGAWNTLASLGVILTHIQSGWAIWSISWTSMWWVIAALIGMIWNDVPKIQELMKDLKSWFHYLWIDYAIPTGNLYMPWNARKAKALIEPLISRYGISRNTKFSDLKIPVIVNAGRQYKKGEQEIVLWWSDNIHDSILASMNVPLPLWSNVWWLWTTKIEGVAMIDYAANERGNPTHWLESVGIEPKDMVVVDAGYSSETWTEKYWADTRQRFLRATQRDFFAKERIRQKWWVVINIDPEIAWPGGWGYINAPKTEKLYQLGIDAMKNIPTSPPSR